MARFATNGTLIYSTYHGGNGVDTLDGIGVDARRQRQHRRLDDLDQPAGPERAAPGTGRPRRRLHVALRRRPARCSSAPTSAARGNDAGRAIAVLPTGWAFVGGSTASPDFPVVAAIQPTFGGELDAFLLGDLADRRRRLVDLLRRHAQRARPGPGPEPGRHADLRRPDLLVRHAADRGRRRPAPAATATRSSSSSTRRTRRSPTPPISAAATTTKAAASPSTASGGCSPPAPRRIRRRARSARRMPSSTASRAAWPAVDTDSDGLPDDWETQFGTDPNSQRRRRPIPTATASPTPRSSPTTPTRPATSRASSRKDRPARSSTIASRSSTRAPTSRPSCCASSATPAPRSSRCCRSRRAAAPRSTPRRSSASRTPPSRRWSRATSAVVVDRTMTWDGTGFGSHAETSIEQPSTHVVPRRGLDRRHLRSLLPAAEPERQRRRQVTITFLRPSGGPVTKTYTVNPRSRRTINIDNETGFAGRPAERAHAAGSTDVSATIVSTNGVPILVERAMYMTVERPRLRRRPRQRRRHRAADQLVPRRGRDRHASSICSSCWPTRRRRRRRSRSPTCCRAAHQIVRQYSLPAQSRRTVYVDSEPGLANVATSAIVRSLNAAVPDRRRARDVVAGRQLDRGAQQRRRHRHVADVGAGRRRSRRHHAPTRPSC